MLVFFFLAMILLQVCLCSLPSLEEMRHQRPHTSAFLWKLQRRSKDGEVVVFQFCTHETCTIYSSYYLLLSLLVLIAYTSQIGMLAH